MLWRLSGVPRELVVRELVGVQNLSPTDEPNEGIIAPLQVDNCDSDLGVDEPSTEYPLGCHSLYAIWPFFFKARVRVQTL